MKKEAKIIYTAIVFNLFFSIIQIVFGLLGNSRAVVVDGIYAFGYLITNMIALFGERLSRKPANRKHPFGYGLVEYLTGAFIGSFLIAVGILLVVSSIKAEAHIPNDFILLVIVLVGVGQMLLLKYLKKKAHEEGNTIIGALAKETSSEVFGAVVLLFLVALTKLSQFYDVFMYMDKIAAIIISGFIIKVGFEVAFENISDLIGEKEENTERLKGIKDIILNVKEIIEVKNLMILKNGPYSKLYVDVKMNGKITLRVINHRIERIKRKIRRKDPKIKYIVINVIPK